MGDMSDWHNVIVSKNRFNGDFEAELSAFKKAADLLLKQLKQKEQQAV